MKKKIIIACGLIALCGVNVYFLFLKGDSTQPHEFISESGNFKVVFPGQFKRSFTQHENCTSELILSGNKAELCIFSVACYDYSQQKRKVINPEKEIEFYRDVVIKKRFEEVKVEKKISLHGKYPGKEWRTVDPGDGLSRHRIFVVNDRTYALEVHAVNPKWDKWELADAFFSSFRLLQK